MTRYHVLSLNHRGEKKLDSCIDPTGHDFVRGNAQPLTEKNKPLLLPCPGCAYCGLADAAAGAPFDGTRHPFWQKGWLAAQPAKA